MSYGKKKLLKDIIIYAVSAGVTDLFLRFLLRKFDPYNESGCGGKKAKEIGKQLGRPQIDINLYENVIASDVISPEQIDTTFDSIGGLESIKKELYNLVILPLQRPNLFQNYNLLSPPKGILLYGPPGSGKTLLAKAIARESGAVFINVRTSNLTSKWFGDSEKLVNAVFTLAYKLQPSIIFLDEIDSFLGKRRSNEHENLRNIKTEFMSSWDGFTTYQRARVIVLAATNRPEDVDEAILRRLPRVFEVGMPDRTERAQILEAILKGENIDCDIDYDRVASLCEGYSGSDLKDICKQAAYLTITDFLEKEKSGHDITCEAPRLLQHADFEKSSLLQGFPALQQQSTVLDTKQRHAYITTIHSIRR